jgi:hypothetical protein
VLRPAAGVEVDTEAREVRIAATVCLDGGWLEQVACSPRSREHEALVVVDVRPSAIHLALMLAGFEPGRPGRWSRQEDGELSLEPPTGAPLDVLVEHADADGGVVRVPVRRWIRDHLGRHEFPRSPWIFAGSSMAPNPEHMGPGEHYVADMTGSIIGLVTFGDELIGFSLVLADQAEVQPPEWELNTGVVPPVGTPVTIILRPWEDAVPAG